MDKNLKFIYEEKVKRTMESLEKNNMEAFYVEDEVQVLELIKGFVKDGDTVSVGGSQTLFEVGVVDYLRCGKYNFLDRYAENLSGEDLKKIFRKSFFADVYFSSSNAITESGEIYNVDGNGNRVAAMLYGPDIVVVIVGINKIVKDMQAAIERNKQISGPANNTRLNRNTPCTKVGSCMDCRNPERICNEYTVIKRQGRKGRIKVVIVGKQLGY